jgi:hypothetical protein
VELPEGIYDAAYCGNRDAVLAALDGGLDLEAATGGGPTLLAVAAGAGRQALVAALLERGANVHARSYDGTALTRAAEENATEIVRRLLDAGAEVDAADEHGNTPLMKVVTSSRPASRARRRATAEALLRAGANPDRENDGGTTPRQQDALSGGAIFGEARSAGSGPEGVLPPTKDRLSRELGVTAPDTYVSLQRLAFEGSDTKQQFNEYYYRFMSFYFSGAEPGYHADPPEMLVFGATGNDGIQLGYLVHTPELELDDYLVVESYPVGAEYPGLGRSTVEALGHVVQRSLEFFMELSCTDAERLAELSAAVGVDLSKPLENPFVNDRCAPLVPRIPPGYIYRETLDTVGVLAPKDAFSAEREYDASVRWPKNDALLAKATSAFEAGLPGSALVLAKSALSIDEKSLAAELRALAVRAYSALGRPLHAKRCQEGA